MHYHVERQSSGRGVVMPFSPFYEKYSILEDHGTIVADLPCRQPIENQKSFVLRKFRLGEPIPEGSRLIRTEKENCRLNGLVDVYLYEVPV